MNIGYYSFTVERFNDEFEIVIDGSDTLIGVAATKSELQELAQMLLAATR